MRLGTVDTDTNTVIYPHHNIEECRAFLMEHHLIQTYKGGWIGRDMEGVILFCGNDHGWTAAYWYTKDLKQNKRGKIAEWTPKQRKQN